MCAQCGEEHELVDPVFRRPDAYVALSEHEREEHARADDDLCRIDLPDQEPRLFVRCVLPVAVHGQELGIWWGLWAEVAEAAFQRTLELWNEAQQGDESPFAAMIANDVPGHATCGLKVQVQLTGTATRPNIVLLRDTDHAFAEQCRTGVDAHQAHLWIRSMHSGATDGSCSDNPLDTASLRSFVCQHVFDGEVIHYAICDREGDWQFLCEREHGGPEDQPRIVHVGHLVARDPSLRALGNQLQAGQVAERDGPQSEWRIGQI